MITAITTCMGRRSYLETTLPLMLAEFEQVVVVDWSCPEGAGVWATEQGADVVYKTGQEHFSAPQSRNLGVTIAKGDYLAFVDCDYMCAPGIRDELESLLDRDIMVFSSLNQEGYDIPDSVGFIAVSSDKFKAVDGYNENFFGWGPEDLELRAKLFIEQGLRVKRLGPWTLGAITNSTHERERYRGLTLNESAKRNFALLDSYFKSAGFEDWRNDPALEPIRFRKAE